MIPLSLLLLGASACRDWDRFAPAAGGAPGDGGSGGAPSNGGNGGQPGGGQPSGGAAQGGAGGWFDDGLTTRRSIDVVRPASEEAVDDFPILLRLAPGLDVTGELRLVADDHESALPFEVERLVADAESLVWVRVPSVGPQVTRIWLYYGGVAETQSLPPGDTWSNGFVAVWHFEASGEDALAAHSGTIAGATSAVAVVGNGFSFDGDGDHVDVPGAAAFDTMFASGGTLSALVRPNSGGELDRGRIIDRTTDTLFTGGWALTAGDFVQPESFGFAYSFTGGYAWWVTPPQSTLHGEWHHVAATFAEGDAAPQLYIEGVAQMLTVDSPIAGRPGVSAGLSARIGGQPAGEDRDYDGVIDELRASATVRSATWLATEAENMAGGLVSVGDAETR